MIRGNSSVFFNYNFIKIFFNNTFSFLKSIVLNNKIHPASYFLSNFAFSKIEYDDEDFDVFNDFSHKDVVTPLIAGSGLTEGNEGGDDLFKERLPTTYCVTGFKRGLFQNFYKLNNFILLKFITTLFQIMKSKKKNSPLLKYARYISFFTNWAKSRAALEARSKHGTIEFFKEDKLRTERIRGTNPNKFNPINLRNAKLVEKRLRIALKTKLLKREYRRGRFSGFKYVGVSKKKIAQKGIL